MIFYLTLHAWLEKKFLIKNGEILVAVKNMVLWSAYERFVACWRSLRSDEIALIVLNNQTTECKNKRRKQVCHCLLNICEKAVNAVTKMSIFLNLHNFLCLRGKPLNPFNWATPKALSLSNHLLTARNRRKQPSFSLFLCKQPHLVWTTTTKN